MFRRMLVLGGTFEMKLTVARGVFFLRTNTGSYELMFTKNYSINLYSRKMPICTFEFRHVVVGV